jgi:peptide/nickel transport system permease protein
MGSYIAWVNLAILTIFILFSLFAPFLTPYQPNEQSLFNRLQPPVWVNGGKIDHILGTDELGRDIYTRLVYGSRTSISVGVLAALLSGGIGITLGLLSGYFPKADAVIMRIADIQLAFPSILLALAIVAVLGGGFLKLILVLGITAWVSYARVIRSEVLSIKTSDYILAAQTVGVGEVRIMVKHIFPNIIARAVTISTFQVATAIISESSLSFLGLGIPPTIPTWGNMLYAGQLYMSSAWWLSLFPGVCIMLVVLSINILGDVLRDCLAPKTR